MKVLKKIAAAAVIAIAAASAAVADEMGMYARLSAGFSRWDIEDEKCDHGSIRPVFGLTGLTPVEGLSFEAFLDLDFGGKSKGNLDLDTRVITPGIRAVYEKSMADLTGNQNLKKLVPYVGAGLALAFVHWDAEVSATYSSWDANGNQIYRKVSVSDDGDKTYFIIDTLGGWRYDFTDQLSATAELGIRFGGITSWSITAGGLYRIK